MTVGSLFAGIGGIELGFMQSGFQVLWAVEKDHNCCLTYRHNHKSIPMIEEDVRNVNPSSLSAVNIITAGFPCQPFSVAGQQRGFSDDRGNLYYEVIRYVKSLKPRFVFLENVQNLQEHDGGRTFIMIHNALVENGYYIRYRVMRASEYKMKMDALRKKAGRPSQNNECPVVTNYYAADEIAKESDDTEMCRKYATVFTS